MTSKLSKKVIEAGLVPKHTLQLMKMWGMVPEDAEEKDLSILGDSSDLNKMAEELVSDIEELVAVERDIPELRETRLDIDDLFEAHKVPVWLEGEQVQSMAAVDLPEPYRDHAIFCMRLPVGARFRLDGVGYVVTEVELSFHGKQPKYAICKVHKDA